MESHYTELSECVTNRGFSHLKQILSAGKDSADCSRTLIIEDSLIPQLSLSIQGSQLKSCGYAKWFRLSNYVEINSDVECYTNHSPTTFHAWWIVMCLRGVWNFASLSLAVNCVLRLTMLSKRSVTITICFMPTRTCGQVSFLLLSIRHGLNYTTTTWHEDGSGMVLGKLKIIVKDLPIPIQSLDDATFTMSLPDSFRDLHLRGNMYCVSHVLEGVRELLDTSCLANVVSLIGLGADGKLIAKKIASLLSRNSDVKSTSTGHVLPLADNSSVGKESSVKKTFQQASSGVLHSYVESLLNSPQCEHVNRDFNLDLGTYDHVLSDGILNRCVIQLAGDFKDDLDFVRDHIRESGLTKRSQQPSFKIRLPEERSRRNSGNALNRSAHLLTIKSIIVVDRAIDWISPLLTPFTYEAMLDLQWGIESVNLLKVNGSASQEAIRLSDKLYLRIRDMLLSDVGPTLHAEALKIQAQSSDSNTRTVAQGNSVVDMHSALIRMREHEQAQKDLGTHVNLVSQLVKGLWRSPAFYTILKIEDDILNSTSISMEVFAQILCQLAWRNTPIFDVLRLMMLLILTRGYKTGARMPDVRGLMSMVRGVLHALCGVHGPSVYDSWHEFECLVFKNPTNSLSTPPLQQTSQSSPFSFVHSGFTPISVEVLEAVIKQQTHPVCQAANVWRHKFRSSESSRKDGDILLVFPHHITYSELAAIRCLSKSINRKFIIIAGNICGYKYVLGKSRVVYTDLLRQMVL